MLEIHDEPRVLDSMIGLSEVPILPLAVNLIEDAVILLFNVIVIFPFSSLVSDAFRIIVALVRFMVEVSDKLPTV